MRGDILPFNYDSYPGNYQYHALTGGNWIQRFWHRGKLHLVDMLMPLRKTDHVLDIGCGSGNLCLHLASKCQKIIGIDAKESAIAFANQRKKQERARNCIFVESVVPPLPFSNNTFDKVFLLDVIEHLQQPVHLLREARRVLKPGGSLMITVVAVAQPFWSATMTV